MKIIRSNFGNKESFMTLKAEDEDDIWVLYNVIRSGDIINVTTSRNVTKEGTKKTERMLVKLKLELENIEFEAQSSSLRCKGRTIEENQYVPLGSYHTAVIDTNYAFTLYKQEFDEYTLDSINEAADVNGKAETGAVVLQEGIAHFCLLSGNVKMLIAKVIKSIPKKRRGGDTSAHDKAMLKFYELCYTTFTKKFDFQKLKVILIASPGKYAENLLNVIVKDATTENNKLLIDNRSKIVVAHTNNGYLQALDEILDDKNVQQSLVDTKYLKNSQIIEEFFKHLELDDDRSWYGKDEVVKSIAITGAVKCLLMLDSLFRNDDAKIRKFYIGLSDKVKDQGGEVAIFSTLHDSGSQLDKVGGLAVVLNYPIPGLDEEEDEEDE